MKQNTRKNSITNSRSINRCITQSQTFTSYLPQKSQQKNIKNIFTDQTTYTYKPQTNKLSYELYPQSRQKVQISKQNIFQRLIQNMKNKKQQLKLIKLEKQTKEFQEYCSFKPEINEKSKKIVEKDQGKLMFKNPFDRLYNQKDDKNKANEQQKYLSLEQKQLQFCTFQPQINQISKKIINSQTSQLQPLHQRFQSILKQKRQKQKQIQQLQNQQITKKANFKIQNEKTKQIINKNLKEYFKSNLVQRLVDNYIQEKQDKLNKLSEQQEKKIKEECTFRPMLNKHFYEINGDTTLNNKDDFLVRQKKYQESIKENLEYKSNQIVPSFRPQVNKLSQLICRDRQNQTLSDKINRLNIGGVISKQLQVQKIQKQVYKSCTFHPQINQISKALQGPQKHHSCDCHPQQQKFDFKPKINQKSKQILASKSKQTIAIATKNNKQQQINKIKMQTEYKQLIQCTFQPKIKIINKEKLKLNQAVEELVPGVKEYIEKKNIQRRRKQQQEKFQQELFNLQKKYKPRSVTKTQQFNLSHKVYNKKNKANVVKQEDYRNKIESHKFNKELYGVNKVR